MYNIHSIDVIQCYLDLYWEWWPIMFIHIQYFKVVFFVICAFLRIVLSVCSIPLIQDKPQLPKRLNKGEKKIKRR